MAWFKGREASSRIEGEIVMVTVGVTEDSGQVVMMIDCDSGRTTVFLPHYQANLIANLLTACASEAEYRGRDEGAD